MQLTQRRINLALIALVAGGSTIEWIIFALRDGASARSFGYGIGALISFAALWLYLQHYDWARYLIVVAAPALIGLFLDESHLVRETAMEIFLPAVLALILAEPAWVGGAGLAMLAIIAARTGGDSTYFRSDNLVLYLMLIGGLILSRLAVDTAQRLAEANALAQAAHQEAEERARELAERNAQLQQTLAENAAQREVIRELSVPILPLSEHALILPLVGSLDSARLQHAQERLLATLHAGRAQLLVIDLTGASAVDSDVARGIVRMMGAARLLGVEVALAGIRAEIAQTIVGLGLDLGDVAVFRDVRSIIQAGAFAATSTKGA